MTRRGIKGATVWELWKFEEENVGKWLKAEAFDQENWLDTLKGLLDLPDNAPIYSACDDFPFWYFTAENKHILIPHPKILKKQKDDLENLEKEVDDWQKDIKKLGKISGVSLPERLEIKWKEFPKDAPPSFIASFQF